MKTISLVLILAVFFYSCKKDDTVAVSFFSEARYAVTITGQWKSPAFTVPGGAHYTTFIGMVHNSNGQLWKEGRKATYGMEVLAETGGGGPILSEIDSTIRVKSALSLLLFVAPSTIGSSGVNFYCNTNYSRVSFASMLGPTPDWFVGVSDIELFSNNKWVGDTTINLYAYDAGTEDGDVFGYSNPPSVPVQDIHVLQPSQATVLANGNPTLIPIATARFIKVE
jgi:Spondin_N